MLSQQEAIDSLKATSESLKRQNRLLQELIAKQAEELAAAKKRTSKKLFNINKYTFETLLNCKG